MSDTPRSDARERETEYCLIYTHWHCGWTMSRTLERELNAVTAERDALRNALHCISLASQNSMSSKDECGRIARAALSGKEWA